MSNASDETPLKAKLLQETSQIPWKELQTYYAKGQVVQVTSDLDLLEVAAALAADDVAAFKSWMAEGKVGEVSPDCARQWYENDAALWAVVVMPWVLVQQRLPRHLH